MPNKYIIGVTRPQQQGIKLVNLLQSEKIQAIHLPLIAIVANSNSAEILVSGEQLAGFSLAIFISENAVHHSLPHWQNLWPNDLPAFSIGNSTAKALQQYNVAKIITTNSTNFSSETLLQHEQLQSANIAGKKILIVKGEGGRDLIRQTLISRGGQISQLSCYRRQITDINNIFTDDIVGNLSALIFTSSEAIANLSLLTNKNLLAQLRTKTIFVNHQNIAASGQLNGYKNIIVCPNGNENIAKKIFEYFSNISCAMS